MSKLNGIFGILLLCISIQGFAETCQPIYDGDSFYTFDHVLLKKNEVTCNYRCYLFGCDYYKSYKIPGHYTPAQGTWFASNDGMECNFNSKTCSFYPS